MNAQGQRVFILDGVHNFRDYGDWRTRDGGRILPGKLFRSGHHADATASDEARIANLSIRTVVDLRRVPEQIRQPTAWLERLGAKLLATPATDNVAPRHAPHIEAMKESRRDKASMRNFMVAHYRDLPFETHHLQLFARYFQSLATEDGGVLIHCAAGKDRTGILAALTHHLLGVHPEDMMEDYVLSNDASVEARLPGLVDSFRDNYGIIVDLDGARTVMTVEPAFLESAWEAIAERSGSVDAYIAETLGIDPKLQERIRKKYLC